MDIPAVFKTSMPAIVISELSPTQNWLLYSHMTAIFAVIPAYHAVTHPTPLVLSFLPAGSRGVHVRSAQPRHQCSCSSSDGDASICQPSTAYRCSRLRLASPSGTTVYTDIIFYSNHTSASSSTQAACILPISTAQTGTCTAQ